ncbi:MAG: hypothetical protein H6708_09450 [Kofleriaceae bacterium]|nr:hypothetical protein [Myxococcales bacterium]MCB9560619.1 hypothetical protein [Kofleriaceae bacterium]
MVRLVLGFLLVTGGCVVGDPTPRTLGDGPDAGTAPDASGGGLPDGAAAACEPAQAVTPDGHHNPGQVCLGCHDGNTAGAPLFTLAGTLYDSAAGTNPVAAATIIVTDANGTELKLPTSNNGNFFTSTALTLPITVAASKCPDTRMMSGNPAVTDCNSCHAGGLGRINL